MCATNNYTSYQIKPSVYSLNNWVEQLGLYCTDGKYIGMIGALAFLGSAIACAILPILGDKIGRYPVFIVTQACQIPMFFVAIYTNSLATVYFIVFFLGFCLIGRFTCGFVLFVELLPEKYKAVSGSAILIGYSISLLEVTAYYAFISQNSVPTIWLGFILNTVTFFANFIVPESPQWLVS
jgi:MFS family permease